MATNVHKPPTLRYQKDDMDALQPFDDINQSKLTLEVRCICFLSKKTEAFF